MGNPGSGSSCCVAGKPRDVPSQKGMPREVVAACQSRKHQTGGAENAVGLTIVVTETESGSRELQPRVIYLPARVFAVRWPHRLVQPTQYLYTDTYTIHEHRGTTTLTVALE